MRKSKRQLTPAEQARVSRSQAAAEGPDREDLIRQAQEARIQAALEDVMAILKAARETAGISLRDLEERTGISRGNLSRLENGSTNPTIATLRRYAGAIGKTVNISVD